MSDIMAKMGRKASRLGRCHKIALAKLNFRSITDDDLRLWWDRSNGLAVQNICYSLIGGMPDHPVPRIQFLKVVRREFLQSHYYMEADRVTAAIYREVVRSRIMKALDRFFSAWAMPAASTALQAAE